MTDWIKKNAEVESIYDPGGFYNAYISENTPSCAPNLSRFFNFACERMDIFHHKQAGVKPPWTSDPILAQYKFTNCYRILDRVSQYLIREIIGSFWDRFEEVDDADTDQLRELFCRVYIFKMFNKIATWEAIPEKYRHDCSGNLNNILNWAVGRNGLFANAYLMAPAGEGFNYSRVTLYMTMLENILNDEQWLTLLCGDSLTDSYELLARYHGFGPFLSYQFAMDFAYAAPFRVNFNDFVVPGPGCIRGMEKVFGGLPKLTAHEQIGLLRYLQYHQGSLFKKYADKEFPYLIVGQEELLKTNDFQNLFCEFDKYSRMAYPNLSATSTRTKIKNTYDADLSYEFNEDPDPVLPPSWCKEKSNG